jgi:hypothetical protein
MKLVGEVELRPVVAWVAIGGFEAARRVGDHEARPRPRQLRHPGGQLRERRRSAHPHAAVNARAGTAVFQERAAGTPDFFDAQKVGGLGA